MSKAQCIELSMQVAKQMDIQLHHTERDLLEP
jgi:hypothetical protein